MYNNFPDLTPIFYVAFSAVGMVLGLFIAAILWPIVGTGWFTFALPVIGGAAAFLYSAWGLK